jgi:hypothetical protein
MYFPIIILITLLVFIKARRKFGFNFFILFLIYLISNLGAELSSSIMLYYHSKGNNMLIYNISILIEGLTFCYMFYYANNNSSVRKAVIISGSVFLVFWIINIRFIQKNDSLDTYSYLFSSIVLAIFSLITINRFVFLNSFNNPFYNFFFWTSIGILFCYLGNIPYLASFNILAISNRKTAISLSIISQVVNSILYLMIITGILCHRPETNYK